MPATKGDSEAQPGRMRIAFVNTLYPPYGPRGGAEATLGFLVRTLSERGHDCRVITLTPDRRPITATIDGVDVRYLPLANVYWPHGGNRPRLLRPIFQLLDAYNPIMRRRLAATLKVLRPDVVHAHNLQGFSVSAWSAARDAGIPLVQTMHDYYLACPRSTMWRPGRGLCERPCAECRAFAWPRRHLSHLPAAATCVSHKMLDLIRSAGVFRGTPVRVIRGNNPPITDHADITPMATETPGALRLGFLGRLDPIKGVELLIDAVAALPLESVHLAIAGRGEETYEAGLRARAAGLSNIVFAGEVTPGCFLPQIDLLVAPSIWQEPLTRVVAEAFAYGVPSLVTPMGGLPENIIHGVNGLVAESADTPGLLGRLREVLAGQWRLSAMRDACLAAAGAYAPALIASQYEAVLSAAAQGRVTDAWSGDRIVAPVLETGLAARSASLAGAACPSEPLQ